LHCWQSGTDPHRTYPAFSFSEAANLLRMCTLLQNGLVARTPAYYIHPGELKLCLYNWLAGSNPWQHVFLWDNPAAPQHLLGWALLSTPWSAFDVFVRPDLWNSPWAGEVNTWVEEQSFTLANQQGHRQIWRLNVAETDRFLQEHVCRRGFQEVPGYAMLLLECDLR
jgi:hypothetical protein